MPVARPNCCPYKLPKGLGSVETKFFSTGLAGQEYMSLPNTALAALNFYFGAASCSMALARISVRPSLEWLDANGSCERRRRDL
jgi:hypothetical protein